MTPPAKVPTAECAVCHTRYPIAPPGSGKVPSAFCSERCRIIDLAQWMSGGYAIAGASVDPDEPPEGSGGSS